LIKPEIADLFFGSFLSAFLKCTNTSFVVPLWLGFVFKKAIKSSFVINPVCSAPGEGDLAFPPFLRRFEPSPSESTPDPSTRLRFDEEREEGPGEEFRLVEERPEGEVARFAR
jgi:hypothetical protein